MASQIGCLAIFSLPLFSAIPVNTRDTILMQYQRKFMLDFSNFRLPLFSCAVSEWRVMEEVETLFDFYLYEPFHLASEALSACVSKMDHTCLSIDKML